MAARMSLKRLPPAGTEACLVMGGEGESVGADSTRSVHVAVGGLWLPFRSS